MQEISQTAEAKLIVYLVVAGSLVRGPLIDEQCTKCLACQFRGLGHTSKFCAKARGFLRPVNELLAKLTN